MTKPHPHAILMAEYAKDAAETYTPWGRWQFRGSSNAPWEDCTSNPGWIPAYSYRRKPQPVQRFIPVMRMPSGALILKTGRTSRDAAVDDEYNERCDPEILAGILHVEIHPETLELVSASMEKL